MEPFKNLLNLTTIEDCAMRIQAHYPEFNLELFLTDFSTLEALELKARLNLISQNLDRHMPHNYEQCEAIFLALLREKNQSSYYFSGFIWWAIQMFFVNRWINNLDYIEPLVFLLKEITPVSSSEFSIRYLLQAHVQTVHPLLLSFVHDDNEHVRRWVSEGCRPRLPWGMKLDIFCQYPQRNIPIIQALQADSSLYVRKSVANHLNDISKDNPQFVIQWISEHMKEAQTNPQLMWTFRHALRGLIKKGNQDALKLLGVSETIEYEQFLAHIHFQEITKSVHSYQLIDISFQTSSVEKLIVDFKLRYPGINGLKNKIIKGKNFFSQTGLNTLSKKINLFDNSTSTFASGKYELDIMLNGKTVDTVFWILK